METFDKFIFIAIEFCQISHIHSFREMKLQNSLKVTLFFKCQYVLKTNNECQRRMRNRATTLGLQNAILAKTYRCYTGYFKPDNVDFSYQFPR